MIRRRELFSHFPSFTNVVTSSEISVELLLRPPSLDQSVSLLTAAGEPVFIGTDYPNNSVYVQVLGAN